MEYTPEQKAITITAPDGTSNLADMVEQALAWANDPAAVEARRQELAVKSALIAQQRRERECQEQEQERERQRLTANRSLPAPGWSVAERRSTGTWIAARGAQREEFDTEEEAIAFTHE